MSTINSSEDALEVIRQVRQVRQYVDGDVTDEQLSTLMEIARWTGSALNKQSWRFVIVRDKEVIRQLAELREHITWVADAVLVIALVNPMESPFHEAYDEGRVTERLMIAASIIGLGAGTAWFGTPEATAKARELLNIPEDKSLRSIVAFGHYRTTRDPSPTGPRGGRLPLDELFSYEKFS